MNEKIVYRVASYVIQYVLVNGSLSEYQDQHKVRWRQVRSYSGSIESGMCLGIPLEVSFWIQKIFCQHSYMGMLVLTHDASAICQDPNLFLLEVD